MYTFKFVLIKKIKHLRISYSTDCQNRVNMFTTLHVVSQRIIFLNLYKYSISVHFSKLRLVTIVKDNFLSLSLFFSFFYVMLMFHYFLNVLKILEKKISLVEDSQRVKVLHFSSWKLSLNS